MHLNKCIIYTTCIYFYEYFLHLNSILFIKCICKLKKSVILLSKLINFFCYN